MMAASRSVLRSSDVTAALHITRQAAHRHLRALVESGELIAEGAGRGARYRVRASGHRLTFLADPASFDEARIWPEVRSAQLELRDLPAHIEQWSSAAVGELSRNVASHAEVSTFEVLVTVDDRDLTIEVSDRGRGLWKTLAPRFGSSSSADLALELMKGGLAFEQGNGGLRWLSQTSQRLEVRSGEVGLRYDHARRDYAVMELTEPLTGTSVAVSVNLSAQPTSCFIRQLERDLEGEARLPVALLTGSDGFVSRGEAQRLMLGADRFHRVVLDFSGVHSVGRAFLDELFCVFAPAHPHTELRIIEAPAVVERFAEWASAQGKGSVEAR